MRATWMFVLGPVVALVPSSGRAQEPGAVEVGLIGRHNVYDIEVGVDSSPGIGVLLGVFVRSNLALEVEGSYAVPGVTDPTDPDGPTSIAHGLYQARIVFTHRLGDRAGLLLGGGYAYDHYTRERDVAARGGGVAGMIGLRYRFSDRVSTRFQGGGYLISGDEDALPIPRAKALNLGVELGVSLTFRAPEERLVLLPPPPPDTVIVSRTAPLPQGAPETLCLATGEAVTVYLSPDGDTLVGDRRIAVSSLRPTVTFAGSYALERDWYASGEPLTFEESEYRPSGTETALNCADILRVGEHRGVSLFVRRAAPPPFTTVWVPVRPGAWHEYRANPAPTRD